MHEIHWSYFRPNDDHCITHSSAGQCLMLALSLAGLTVTQLVFSLALTVCELRALFFVSSQYMYAHNFDCFIVIIY